MRGFKRFSISEIILDASRPPEPSARDLVWNLNLDQIESGSGKVLERVRVPVSSLGPSTYPFSAGTVLYSKLRPYLNKVVVADADGYATTELVPLRCNPEKVYAPYLAYYLRSPEFLRFANTVVAGAKMPRMVMSEFWQYQVPVPSIPEQCRIAAILDQADALRAKRREALALLDELQRGIFIELFGDPAQNPKRFPIKQLGTLVSEGDTINYGVVQPGDDLDSGVPLIRVGDLVGGRVRHDSLKKIDPSIEVSYKRSRLQGDEILVSCVGSIGVVALATNEERGFNIARAVARIRLAPSVNRVFMAAQLATSGIQRYFISELRTVSQPTLNIKQISETEVMCPSTEIQNDFEERLAKLVAQRDMVNTAARELDLLFASLQFRAFEGEL